MDGPLGKTKAILEIYLKRGQLAIEAAERADWDSFINTLQDRKAAFNNFRYWDFVAQQYDPQYSADQAFQVLWKHIREKNVKLEAVIRELCQQLNHQLVKATHNREKLSKFRSAIRRESGISLGI